MCLSSVHVPVLVDWIGRGRLKMRNVFFWRFMIHGIRAEHKDRYGDPVTWIKMDNMDKSIKK